MESPEESTEAATKFLAEANKLLAEAQRITDPLTVARILAGSVLETMVQIEHFGLRVVVQRLGSDEWARQELWSLLFGRNVPGLLQLLEGVLKDMNVETKPTLPNFRELHRIRKMLAHSGWAPNWNAEPKMFLFSQQRDRTFVAAQYSFDDVQRLLSDCGAGLDLLKTLPMDRTSGLPDR
jgi:hypothetical protein